MAKRRSLHQTLHTYTSMSQKEERDWSKITPLLAISNFKSWFLSLASLASLFVTSFPLWVSSCLVWRVKQIRCSALCVLYLHTACFSFVTQLDKWGGETGKFKLCFLLLLWTFAIVLLSFRHATLRFEMCKNILFSPSFVSMWNSFLLWRNNILIVTR